MANRSRADWSISRSSRFDGRFRAADQVADGEVAHAIGLDGALDGLLGQPRHHQELLLQFVQALLKPYARHPNLPVM